MNDLRKMWARGVFPMTQVVGAQQNFLPQQLKQSASTMSQTRQLIAHVRRPHQAPPSRSLHCESFAWTRMWYPDAHTCSSDCDRKKIWGKSNDGVELCKRQVKTKGNRPTKLVICNVGSSWDSSVLVWVGLSEFECTIEILG